MKVVYIASPYRASNKERRDLHIRYAEMATLAVAELGAMPINPVTNTAFMDDYAPEIEDEFWLEGTAELLKRSDAVFVTQLAHKSTGAKMEQELAQKLEIPVFHTVRELHDWLTKSN